MGAEPDLRAAVLQGVKWTTLGRIVVEGLAFGSTLVVARIVPPAEYGKAVITLIVYALAVTTATQAFGVPIVQRETITRAHVRAAVALSLICGFVLTGFTAGFGLLLADSLFGGGTSQLFVLASPLFVLAALGAVPQALLQRRLAFRNLAMAEVLGGIPGAATTVAAAFAGLDAGAIVLGVLVASLASALVLIRMAPAGWPRWDRAAARDILGFGLPSALGALVYNATRNVDYAIVGALLSPATAGQYARAYQLGVDYQGKISGILLRVALPAYSLARDVPRISALRTRIVRAHATALFPLLALLAATAPIAVPLLYGPAWHQAIVPTQVLSLAGMVVVLGTGSGPLIVALGRPRVLLTWNIVGFVVFGGAIFIAAHHGLMAVCVTAVVVNALLLAGLQDIVIRPLIGVSTIRMLVDDAGPALVASAALFLITSAVVHLGTEAVPPVVLLSAAVLVGSAAYLGVLRAVFPATAADMTVLGRQFSLARRSRKRDIVLPPAGGLGENTCEDNDNNATRVIITNTVALNTGDAAILQAVVQTVHSTYGPNSAITVYDDQARAVGPLYPQLAVRQSLYPRVARYPELPGLRQAIIRLQLCRFWYGVRLAESSRSCGLARVVLGKGVLADVRRYAECDVVISSGGTYLVPYYPLGARLFEFELASALGKPLVLFTQSVGDLTQHPEGPRAGKLLSSASLVLLRDERSRTNVRALGVPDRNIVVTADAAFGLSLPAEPSSCRPREGLEVGISVRQWNFFADNRSPAEGMHRYLEAISSATSSLVEKHGAHVTFISTCQGRPDYWTDDSAVAVALAEDLPPHVRANVDVDRLFRRPAELQRKLSEFDFVIATRMHLAILALTVDTPVLPIAYEFKTTELFEQLGQGRWTIPIEDLTADRLVQAVDAFVADFSNTKDEQRAATRREHGRASAVSRVLRRATGR